MQTLHEVSAPDNAAARPVVVFAHANGYPPESYRTLFEPLLPHCRLMTVEHRPFWQSGPALTTQNWRVYADDLVETLKREATEPVFLVGHSMGAVIGMLAALQQPGLFRGIVALDPVLIPFKMWLPGQILRAVGKELPMVQSALRRPGCFDSHEAAFAFYRKKRPFRRVSDEVLWDYVLGGHATRDGGVSLRWTGAWEACVYRSAPLMLSRLRGLRITTLGIVGRDSDVCRPGNLEKWQRAMPSAEIQAVEGGHLLPLENPGACVKLITPFLSREFEPREGQRKSTI